MKWNEDNSYLERDFVLATKKGIVESITIVESKEGYYLTVKVSWSKEELYISTRRDRSQPRYFKDLDRLVDSLRENASGVNVNLVLSSEPPAKRKINRVYKRKRDKG